MPPRAELFEAYLGLPEAERAKVDASPKGQLFSDFA